MNLFSFAFVDPSLFFATMTLKYGKHFADVGAEHLPSVFADCRIIPLRGAGNAAVHDSDTEQVNYPLLGEWPSARQLLENVTRQIGSHLAAENLQLGRVEIQSLQPGGSIPWHVDDSAYAQKHIRFKLLVSPCSGGSWYSGGEALAPGVGNLSFVNHRVLHSAINLGSVPQISLVVDVQRPPQPTLQ